MAGRRRDGDRIPADRERNSRRRRVMVVVVTEVMSFDRIGVMRDLGVDVDGVIRVGEAIDLCFLKRFGEKESVVVLVMRGISATCLIILSRYYIVYG